MNSGAHRDIRNKRLKKSKVTEPRAKGEKRARKSSYASTTCDSKQKHSAPKVESNYSRNKERKLQKEEDLKLYRHKIFINGLPYHQSGETDAELFDLCLKEGAKGAIRLVQKKGYGFGYLVFHTNEQAKRAVARLTGKSLFGRLLRVEQPKAPDPEKIPFEVKNKSARSIFNRQLLLFNLPQFVNEEVLADALSDHFNGSVYRESIESIKVVRRGKAFITFKAPFEDQLQNILSSLQEHPLSILGNVIDASKALPPHEARENLQMEKLNTNKGTRSGDSCSEKASCMGEMQKLMKLNKSNRSYCFFLQELGEPSDKSTFRSQFTDRFEVQNPDDILDLTLVSSNIDASSTGLWKVEIRRYLTAYKIFSLCSGGKEEGKVRVELC